MVDLSTAHPLDKSYQIGNLVITKDFMNDFELRNVIIKVFDEMHKEKGETQ